MASSAELLTPYYATLAPTLIAQTTKYLGSNWDEGTRVLEHAIISVANKGGEGRELLNGVIKVIIQLDRLLLSISQDPIDSNRAILDIST